LRKSAGAEREREGVYPWVTESVRKCEGTGVAGVAVCPIAWRVCSDELQNFGVGRGAPPPPVFCKC
jgi:hypothetical protein